MTQIKLPSKTELKVKIPDIEILEKIYYKGFKLKQSIDMLNKSIVKRQIQINLINKMPMMKAYRTHELLIKTTQSHIVAKTKQFKTLFDDIK